MHLKRSKNLTFQINCPLDQFVVVTLDQPVAALVGFNRISAKNFDYRLPDAIYDKLLEEAGELSGVATLDPPYNFTPPTSSP